MQDDLPQRLNAVTQAIAVENDPRPIEERVVAWANAKNLIVPGNHANQFLKLMEEIGELSAAMQKGDLLKIKDGIGDASVVLTILANQFGLTFEGCREFAWNEIANRKGTTVDGVFVKEV